jgi:hypothetical protein
MSGWDASSRPSWDSQGAAGENTQAFGLPEFPEDEGSGFPSSPSPGTPPPIFLQDYDKTDFGPSDLGLTNFGPADSGHNLAGPADFEQRDKGRNRRDDGGYGRGQNGPGQNGFGQNGFGPNGPGQNGFGQNGPGQNGFGPNGFGQEPQQGRGYGRDEDRDPRGYGQRGPVPQDPRQDYTRLNNPRLDNPRLDDSRLDSTRLDNPRYDSTRQGAARDYGTGDYPSADQADPRTYGDREQAARSDPALRDFFAPQSARQDERQDPGPRYGARGYPGESPGQGPGPGPGQGHGPAGPAGPRQANGHRQPPGPVRQPSRWDTQAPRPGPRTARRQEIRAERGNHTMATIAIAIVVVLGIAIGAYMLLHHNSAPPASAPTTAPTYPSQAAKPSATPASRGGTAKSSRYRLTTPAKAGGYTKLASVPTAIQTAAGATAKAIHDAAVSDGGKVTGQVAAGYQLSGGQVLAFSGYTGTFNPAKVMASLATLSTDSHTQAAGPHGGKLGCATVPGPRSGTVCVWVTTTTIGITEFFASDGLPEVVGKQSRAAADAVKLRASVETAKA